MMTLDYKLEDLRDEGQEEEWPGSVNKEEGHLSYLLAQWYCARRKMTMT